MNESIIGYVVVDKETKKLDWDGELHPLRVDAIESMTGPHQMWCKSLEDETEDRAYWGSAYDICAVLAPPPMITTHGGTLSNLTVGQEVQLVARHKMGKSIPITATARKVFDRVLPELSPEDWFVYGDGWTLHDPETKLTK
jgi:hypothetical protein